MVLLKKKKPQVYSLPQAKSPKEILKRGSLPGDALQFINNHEVALCEVSWIPLTNTIASMSLFRLSSLVL